MATSKKPRKPYNSNKVGKSIPHRTIVTESGRIVKLSKSEVFAYSPFLKGLELKMEVPTAYDVQQFTHTPETTIFTSIAEKNDAFNLLGSLSGYLLNFIGFDPETKVVSVPSYAYGSQRANAYTYLCNSDVNVHWECEIELSFIKSYNSKDRQRKELIQNANFTVSEWEEYLKKTGRKIETLVLTSSVKAMPLFIQTYNDNEKGDVIHFMRSTHANEVHIDALLDDPKTILEGAMQMLSTFDTIEGYEGYNDSHCLVAFDVNCKVVGL